MAGKKQAKKQRKTAVRRRFRGALGAVMLVIFLLGGFFAWMAGSAHVTRLRYAQVYLEDLPAAFDGTTLLFISDVDICNAADSAASVKLMKKLNELNVDMLLLGGDYTTDSALEIISGTEADHSGNAAEFIASLASFSAPLGKFAVAGEEDNAQVLESMFALSGVQLLTDACATVNRDGARLVIAGLSDVSEKKTPYEQIGGYFTGDECVIALAHNPSAYVGVRVSEARGGGAWADMVLAGHTLGGQIRIGNRTIRTMPEEEARCIAGWYYEDDLPMLVSQGLGCKAAKLRLGTRSEVWHITLRKPQARTLPKL